MKNKGLHQYRFKQNPLEKKFAKAWETWNERGKILEYLLTVGDQRYRALPSDAEVTCAATVIQWLGSPVGQDFLNELGFELKKL